MTIPQISIFIENRKGTIQKVLNIFKQSDIQLITTTIADTEDYGIFRVICDAPEKAMEALHEAGIPSIQSDVFAVKLEDRPGCAADTIALFSEAGLNINYLYSFLLEGSGILIFSTDTPDHAREVISEHHLQTITESAFM